LVQLNALLLVVQAKFNPSKCEIRLRVETYSAGVTAYSSVLCYLSAAIKLAKRKNSQGFLCSFA